MKDHAKTFRTATITFAAVALTILSDSPAFGAPPAKPAAKNVKSVRFMKRDIRMAGNLYLPPGFSDGRASPTVGGFELARKTNK